MGNGRHCCLTEQCHRRGLAEACSDDSREQFSRLIASDTSPAAGPDFPRPCTDGPFAAVERLAEGLRQRGEDSIPVSTELVRLADESRPVEVRQVCLNACCAATWKLEDSWVIQVSARATPQRRRVSVFHEAFHIMAHSRSPVAPAFRRRGSEDGCFNELLADHFAVCVLTPRHHVSPRWARTPDLEQIARAFDVPPPVMRQARRPAPESKYKISAG